MLGQNIKFRFKLILWQLIKHIILIQKPYILRHLKTKKFIEGVESQAIYYNSFFLIFFQIEKILLLMRNIENVYLQFKSKNKVVIYCFTKPFVWFNMHAFFFNWITYKMKRTVGNKYYSTMLYSPFCSAKQVQ